MSMTRAEMYQTVREALQALEGCLPKKIYVYGSYGEMWSDWEPPTDEWEEVKLSETIAALAALEAGEREVPKPIQTPSLGEEYEAFGDLLRRQRRSAVARDATTHATPPAPPAAEAIAVAFARDFFVRHDHAYSGIEIYEWLKRQVTGPVAPPAAECAAQAALRQVQWCSSDEWQLCPLCDQCEKNGHSPDCLIGAALAAPSQDYSECPRCHVTLHRSATDTHERRHEIREGGEEKP